MPHRVARLLLKAPAVSAAVASLVRQKLQPSGSVLPLPEPLRKRERLELRPMPILHLHCPRVTISRGMGWKREEQEVDLPLARVLFDYSGAEVGWQDGRGELNHVKDNRLLVLPRDTLFEVQMIERLNALGLQPLGPTGLGRFAPENCRQDFTFEEDEDDDDVSMRWVEFNHQELPKLRREGWRITFGEDYPYQVVAADDAWKVDINDSGIDWFDLDLGIEVDGERVPLLPILLDLFERAPDELTPSELDAFGDDHVFGTLPDGRLLPIPAGAAEGDAGSALRAVRQPQDRRGRQPAPVAGRDDPADRDRDARCRTARSNGPAARCCATWRGGWRRPARSRASRPRKGLKATLRHYQEDGFAWLQFLSSLRPVRRAGRRYGARQDGAGAGPHPGREGSRAGSSAVPDRLPDQPRADLAQRGAQVRARPRRCWSCTATSAASCSTRSSDHDVVLTSYALLLRDKDLLLEPPFRMVVLDEAQAIKNPATKLARTACQLKADHRIALSGTPMENHLGELWSVFIFLMPGFLGDRETFRRVFRNQIEKEGDTGPPAAPGQPGAAVPAAPDQGAGGLRAAAQAGGGARDRAQPKASATSTRASACRCTSASATRSSSAASPAATSPSWKRCSSCGRSAATRGCSSPGPAAACASAKFELLMDMLASMVENRAAASSCSRSSSRCWT